MSETPKCPYCGAEMKLHQCKSSIRIWYECECGSESPHISPNWAKDTEESWQEAALSAALHRAEPEMRPLTLEEISEKVYNTDWDFVWLETKGDIFQLQLCPRYVNEEVLGFCWPLSDDEIEENVEEMGKSWRCWPRKPTTEQMAAEKWEE